MNSRVFDGVNTHTFLDNADIGHRFQVLNTMTSANGGKLIDVCNLCKNETDVQMSPDSIISTSDFHDGCRHDDDIASDVNITANYDQPTDITQGDYINNSQPTSDNSSGQTYVSENDTVISSDQSTTPSAPDTSIQQYNQQPQDDTECTDCAQKLDIIGKDDGAIEKFCTGRMNKVEYAVNITIIIIFVAISIMAIQLLFKIAAIHSIYCCRNCKCECSKICPKCNKCSTCCNCNKEDSTTDSAKQLGASLYENYYRAPINIPTNEYGTITPQVISGDSRNVGMSGGNNNNVQLTGSIF